ncbi:hypothetical protein WJX72_001496 [[Myrmecia] bisecta]|uniref:Uncharacterized protein n=1 Tax=[Myrmecia] bisecta TaxID=41462 RepID=A0AAW1R4S5_9CHLO
MMGSQLLAKQHAWLPNTINRSNVSCSLAATGQLRPSTGQHTQLLSRRWQGMPCCTCSRASAQRATRTRLAAVGDYGDEDVEEPPFLWDEDELKQRDVEASMWLMVAGVLAAAALLAPLVVEDNELLIRQHLLDGLPSSGKLIDSEFSKLSLPKV